MKKTLTYEVDVCERCGAERAGSVGHCAVCGKEHCFSCAPMGQAGLEPPISYDESLTFPRLQIRVCFDCAPKARERIVALFPPSKEG